jgi:drug/metabolite transporter (DMT)-like permease
MNSRRQHYLDWGLILVINVMWATQVPVIKGIGDRLGPIAISFVPMILSSLLVLPLLLLGNPRTPWKDLGHFLAAGLFGLAFLQFTYTLGSQRTLAANAGLITLTIPAFAGIAASFLVGERFNVVRVASFILALAGVLLLSLQDLRSANLTTRGYLAGNLIFLTSCAACGFYNVYCKLLVDLGYSEIEVLAYTSAVGSIAGLPLLIWFEPFNVKGFFSAGAPAIWGVAELAIFVYTLPMLLFFYVLKRMDVTQAILGNYLLPFFIALFGFVLFHEPLTLAMMEGGAVVLVSTLIVTVYEEDILRWLYRARTSQ